MKLSFSTTVVFLFLSVYAYTTEASCQAHDDHPKIDQLCGTDVPISDTIFYENTANEPIVLWRVYNTDYPTSAKGRWWSLDKPTNFTKAEYRKANAICPEWSPLSGIVRCTLKPSSQFMIGFTESVQCDNVTYPASDTLQIFLINPWNDLEACATTDWKE